MSFNQIVNLEERLSVIEFKLELILKLTKLDFNLSLDECKTMNELAFILEFTKSSFNSINDLLKSQIKFYQSCKKNTYPSSRSIVKFDSEVDIFSAYSKEEFEDKIWKCIPKFNGNSSVCEKIAKINGIYEMYYDQFANELKKIKRERLDYETKLLTSYKDNKIVVDQIYQNILIMKNELLDNITYADEIIHFFNENELVKISIFYNSILWDKKNDDKKVVINEKSYIFNVCKADHSIVIEQINSILKDKKHECNELFCFLINCDPSSSIRVNKIHELYKRMVQLNKNDYVLLADIIDLKEELKDKINTIDDIYNAYRAYIANI